MATTRSEAPAAPGPRLRFDRNELAGAFGDIGTDFPLIAGLILVAGLDAASVLVMFGLMQVLTGLTYGIPMPAQPLKAMAALTISQQLAGSTLYGGGLAIGVVMLLLAVSGMLERVARAIPVAVIRGIQIGLALQLTMLALGSFVPADGGRGWILAAIAAVIGLALAGNRRIPSALVLIVLGIGYAFATGLDLPAMGAGLGLDLPHWRAPSLNAVSTGLIVLAIPQLPLSLGNSVLATRQLSVDLFPHRAPGVRKIGLTYALMNLVNPFFGGVPTCHGSGGIAGHHAFGARTGASVVMYGGMYLGLGLFASGVFGELVRIFPLPLLGVILVFEAAALAAIARDVTGDRAQLAVAAGVALLAAFVPYGYAIGLVAGTIAWTIIRRNRHS